MAEFLKDPKGLFKQVAAESDSSANSTELIDEAKRRALAQWPAQKSRWAKYSLLSPSMFKRARIWVPAFAAAAILSIVLFINLSVKPLHFTVGDETVQRPLGTWIAAGQESISIKFSEGTVITLAGEARARITRADVKGAQLLLERGQFRANVVHLDPPVPWTLYAGPYEIHVTGTQFDIAWDPSLDALDLKMIEGHVIVRGPLLEEGKTISKGEHLQIGLQKRSLTISASSAEDAKPSISNPVNSSDSPIELTPPQEATAPMAEPDAKQASSAPRPENSIALEDNSEQTASWQSLAASGNYRAALQAAEKSGFNEVMRRAPPADLLILADSARFSGDFNKAKDVLLMARKRGVKSRTAFLLGKIAADHQGSPGEAITWFETYLAEEPNGSLSEQALGRLIELKRRGGDIQGAQKHAALYLKRYPRGAFEALAKTVTGP